jgi:recombination protein RecA
MGAWTILIDCENATNGEFMERVSHLNLKRVLRYAPPTLERAFRQIHVSTLAIREREKKLGIDVRPIVVVFDSLTVPPCERELKENDLPLDYTAADWKKTVGRKEQPGERAKVISAEMRKLQSMVVDQNVSVYVINQTRDKIGVMYGCFHYNSRVVLADGSTIKIGKIVNQNMVGLDVLSFDPDTGKIESKKIIEVHDNGSLEDGESFLQITARKRGKNGRTQISCTPNHKIFVPSQEFSISKDFPEKGYKPSVEVDASTLKVGDKILASQPFYLTDDQKQLVYGSILGDGEIRSQKDGSCCQLRIDHGIKQKEYCFWKQQILNPWIGYSFIDEERYNRVGFDTIAMYELINLKKYKQDYIVPIEVLKNFGVLALAISYMDDGTYRSAGKRGNGQATICCKKFKNREQIRDMYKNNFGLDCTINRFGFLFNSQNTKKLHEIISPYIHPSMSYKLHKNFHDKFSYKITEPDSKFRYEAVESEIIDIYQKPPTRSKKKFDITVEGNHSYVVDGAIVHNSPETTSGGNAVKFYASLRIRTATKKKIEHKELGKFSGINMQVKNIKNRGFRPFVVADDVKLYFDQGIDPISGLLNCLIEGQRVTMRSAGNFDVVAEYLPEGKTEYRFKASKGENRIPLQVILDCPKIVDAQNKEELDEYLSFWGSGLAASESGEYGEKVVAFDADGGLFETGEFESAEDLSTSE